MTTQQKKVLILFGMHKSGISVISGCLNLLGANFGKSFISANHTGFFENRDIMLWHDIFLRDLGCKWDMVGSLPSGWLKRKAAQDIRRKILTFVEKNFSGEECLAINDPRLCRLAPLWMDIFKQTHIEPCFVLMVRHPFEVARSLEKRDGFDLLKSHLLWLVHNREALAVCRVHKHVILTYDALLADPAYCMENISRGLGIDFPKEPKKEYQKLIDFVRPELKHHNGGSQDKNEDDMFAQYAWLYDQFRLNQTSALDTSARTADTLDLILRGEIDHNPAMRHLPLVSRGDNNSMKPEVENISKMFNNLLNIISQYEQADINSGVQRQRLLLAADQQGGALYAQVYFPMAEDGKSYVEEKSQKILLAPDEWQKISVFVPETELLRRKALRFDPLNTKGVIKISAINLIDDSTGKTIWSVFDDKGFQTCTIEGDSLLLGTKKNLHICATGTDPCILLPAISDLPDAPIRLEIWIKVRRDLTELCHIWKEMEKQVRVQTGQLADLTASLNSSETDCKKAGEKVKQLGQENEKILKAWNASKIDFKDQINGLTRQLDEQRATSEQKAQELEKQLGEARQQLQQKEKLIGEYFSELTETERKNANLYTWFAKLGVLLGFDETIVSESAPSQKKASKVFAKKAPLDEIMAVFKDFYSSHSRAPEDDTNFLKTLYEELNKELKGLVKSKRWAIGNIIIAILSLGLCKIKVQTAMDSLRYRVEEFESFSSALENNSWAMAEQIRGIGEEFNALIRSFRWRAIHMDINLLKIFFLKKSALRTERIKAILDRSKI